MAATGATTHEDGRALRAQRTRERIVEAVLALLEEGDLRPTGEAIAARAGVSERSIFQHFPERDGLLAAVGARQRERMLAIVRPIDPDGPLEARIEAFVAQRARIWEKATPVRRAALLNEPFSEVVRAPLQAARELSRTEVERVFARELDALPRPARARRLAALAAVAEWPFWESLRAHQGLGVTAAREALRDAVTALLR